MPRLLWSVGSSFAQTVVSAITLLVLYRVLIDSLGTEGLGIWALVLSISSAVSMANFGIAGSLTKIVAEYDANHDSASIFEIVQTGVLSVGSFGLFFVFFAYPCAIWYFRFALEDTALLQAVAVLPIALAAFWLYLITSLYHSTLFGLHRIAERNGILILESLTHLVACIIVAPRYGIVGLAYVRLIQNAVTLLISVAVLRSKLNGLPIVPRRWRMERLREMFGYALGLQAVGILVAVTDPIAKALLSRNASVSLVAIYEMANRLIQNIRAVMVNANQVLVPSFAQASLTEPAKVDALFMQSHRLMFYLALPTFTLLGIFAPLIARVWLGYEDQTFVYSLVALCIGWCLNTIFVPSYFACLGTGELRIIVASHCAITLVTVVLGSVLGGFGGAYVIGAIACATATGGLLQGLLYFRKRDISLSAWIPAGSRSLAFFCTLFGTLWSAGYFGPYQGVSGPANTNFYSVAIRPDVVGSILGAAIILGLMLKDPSRVVLQQMMKQLYRKPP